MGPDDEMIFVEGNSTDDTWERIQEARENMAGSAPFSSRTAGKGKGDAVRKGFSLASKEILMILDADLTVPPEDLPKFYRALVRGKGEFVNGGRLVYPMEGQAMRFLNMVGNKFFALAFSFVLGQRVKDTLCGTKVLSREHYLKLTRAPRVLRRLRTVRRLRSDLRRLPARIKDRRPAGPLPRAHLRHHKHQPVAARRAAAADAGVRFVAPPVRLNAGMTRATTAA